jgi:hypothetical protein
MYPVFAIIPIFEALCRHKRDNRIICVKCRSFNGSIKLGYDAPRVIENIVHVGRARLLHGTSALEQAHVATD